MCQHLRWVMKMTWQGHVACRIVSDTNLATNLPDLATKRGTLATRLGIWNLATFLATFEMKI